MFFIKMFETHRKTVKCLLKMKKVFQTAANVKVIEKREQHLPVFTVDNIMVIGAL